MNLDFVGCDDDTAVSLVYSAFLAVPVKLAGDDVSDWTTTQCKHVTHSIHPPSLPMPMHPHPPLHDYSSPESESPSR